MPRNRPRRVPNPTAPNPQAAGMPGPPGGSLPGVAANPATSGLAMAGPGALGAQLPKPTAALAAPPTGQPYGQRAGQMQARAAAQPAMASEQERQAQLLNSARQAPVGTPLTAATARPREPITAGLAGGAGPGPEVLPSNQANVGSPKISVLMNQLAATTGNQALAEQAARASQRGL